MNRQGSFVPSQACLPLLPFRIPAVAATPAWKGLNVYIKAASWQLFCNWTRSCAKPMTPSYGSSTWIWTHPAGALSQCFYDMGGSRRNTFKRNKSGKMYWRFKWRRRSGPTASARRRHDRLPLPATTTTTTTTTTAAATAAIPSSKCLHTSLPPAKWQTRCVCSFRKRACNVCSYRKLI